MAPRVPLVRLPAPTTKATPRSVIGSGHTGVDFGALPRLPLKIHVDGRLGAWPEGHFIVLLPGPRLALRVRGAGHQMRRREPLSHHARSPVVATLADEIASQADADLHAALASGSILGGLHDAGAHGHAACSCKGCRPAPAPFSTNYTSVLGAASTSSAYASLAQQRRTPVETVAATTPYFGTDRAASPRGEIVLGNVRHVVLPDARRGMSPHTLAEARPALAMRKQYRGSPRTPRDTAAREEEAISICGGRLNVQRSVSHTISDSASAGAALAAGSMPAVDDFPALRAELIRAVEADNELMRLATSAATASSPAVARAHLSAAGAAIQFQQTVDHEQWSL